MRKLAVVSIGLLFGMGLGIAPVTAQETGVANTAEDFKSAEQGEGIFGSNVDIFDLMHRVGSLNGAGVVDDGFNRSQNRRINSQAESLRERQRAILEQQEAEANSVNPPVVMPAE
jgi:membrane protein involved in colicin uptake